MSEQASGKPVGRCSSSRAETGHPCRNGDPDTSGLLKNCRSPAMAALHLPAWKDFNHRFCAFQSFVQRDHANDAVKLVQHFRVVLRQVAQDGFICHEFCEISFGEY